jgi:uncharacterized protein (DUF1501 family)
MTKLTRRSFLGRSGTIALGYGLLRPSSFVLRAAEAAQGSGNDNVLVFVLLRGGVDGLGICPAYGDPEYYKARPTIALPKPRTAGSESLIDLDGYFGLHPALSSLMPAWSEGRLAIVHAAGSRQMTRSHFDAQEFLETGTVGIRGTTTGWMDRCLSRVPGSDVMQGVAFSPLLPRAMMGGEPVLVTQDMAEFELHAPSWKQEAESLLREMYGVAPDARGAAGRLAFETLDKLRRRRVVGNRPRNGALYPVTTFGRSLRQAAQVIRARLGTRCIFVNHESKFDTHSNQLPSNQADFREVALALAALHRDLGSDADRVVTIVASEFGRTVAEDGSQGTDHGTGGVMLVMGGPVRGGRVIAKWPGIAKAQRFEERDLEVTTDFRDVFVETLSRHLGIAEASALFPGHNHSPVPGLFG